MTFSKPVILYFLDCPTATPKQILEAHNMPAEVRFRNAQAIRKYDNPEKCDGVCGAVPALYRDFPTAQQAIDKAQKALEKAMEEAGDERPPELPESPPEPPEDKEVEESDEDEEPQAEEKKPAAKKKASWSSKTKKKEKVK